ncbi:hypothetical protein [Amycolatopsis sp. BJA-103]|uniref:hypothetical protein n=1 Tax=Amycolatopsis sp. BJA-103 TaxID=1911175 RepID=UPI000C77160D|nr:hypothetical protein [Amycolatopsis sp. BJA-103]AUI56783.1 hypothetical protein BKN51_00190 [Amycolatopsis sp. BJA-103]PNE13104.1 hypothetical protein B1H26_42330 [Amycolatopsis sp. BJA-103]
MIPQVPLRRRVRAALPRFRKGIAAVWGTLTTPVVVGVAMAFGVPLDAETAAVIIAAGTAILGPAAVIGSKPNVPKE